MTPTRSRGRRAWPAVAALVLAAMVAVIIGSLHQVRPRVYALNAPNQYPVAALRPGRTTCEGPLRSPDPFVAVGLWGATQGGTGTLSVTVRDGQRGPVLASGKIGVNASEAERDVTLSAAEPARRPLDVCVTADGAPFVLAGGGAVNPRVVMTGFARGQEFALLLLGRRRTLVSAFGASFARARLFKLSWLGSWTFWLLAVALLSAFPLAGVAVSRAVSATGDQDASDAH